MQTHFIVFPSVFRSIYSTKLSYKRVLQILVAGDIVKTASYLFSQKKEEQNGHEIHDRLQKRNQKSMKYSQCCLHISDVNCKHVAYHDSHQ